MALFFISEINRRDSENRALLYSIRAADKFHSHLIYDLALVQKIAHSNTVLNWFTDERDNEKKLAAYHDIMGYFNVFEDGYLYFVINETLNKYYISNELIFSDFLPFARLNPVSRDDFWYFESIENESDYLLEIGVDKNTNIWKLWINHKIKKDGEILGVLRSVLPIQSLFDDMFFHHVNKDNWGYIIDKHGAVIKGSIYSENFNREERRYIHDVLNYPALVSVIERYLKNIDSYFIDNDAQARVVKLTRWGNRYAALSPVTGSTWSIVIFYNSKSQTGISDIAKLIPFLLLMLFVLILYTSARSMIIKKHIFLPLNTMRESISESKTGNTAIYGVDRDDEIGMLARSIKEMQDSIIAQSDDIRKAYDFTRLVLDEMPLCFQLWDKNLKILDCNTEAVKTFFLNSKQEFIEKFWNFNPTYQQDGTLSSERVTTYMKKAFEKGKCNFKWIHRLPDNTLLQMDVHLVRLSMEDDYVVVSYAKNLQEYYRIIKEIQRQDSLLKTVNSASTILLQSEPEEFESNLHNCMGMIAHVVHADRISIWKNQIVDEDLCCKKLYEWSGTTDLVQGSDLIPYKNVPGWQETLSNGLCIKNIVRDMPPKEQAYLLPQGILSILVEPVFVRDKFWGFVAFDNCHAERIFTESEESILRSASLLITNALLRSEMTLDIRASSIQLESALKKAQEANNVKNNFLANISHEMRTPLNAVIGLARIILTDNLQKDEFQPIIEKIYKSAVDLLALINDILDISKIEVGRLTLILAEYDLISLINDSIIQSSIHLEGKPIKFALDVREDLHVALCGDATRIKQILNNLLSNAFKYTRKGVVKLSISDERDGDNSWLTICVRDTGVGIREEDIGSLFKEYSQIELESNRKIEGTGLGLSITKKIVEMMGGTISVESEYGKGSVFTVRLMQKLVSDSTLGPQAKEKLENFCYETNKYDLDFKTEYIKLPYARVLVVDDVMTNLDVAKGMMSPYGMQIDCVTSGQSAIDVIRNEKVIYDAVFMDHMMPEMDGVEAARIIREIGTEYAKNVPIIALTANAVVGSEKMFLSKGFQAFISKPIEMERLDAVIMEWLWNKEKDAELAANIDQRIGDEKTDLDIRSKQDSNVIPGRNSEIDRYRVGNTIAGIDMARGIMLFENSEANFQKILHSFAVNTRPLLEIIKDVDENSLDEYAVAVHGIKGSARGICASILGNRAEGLENAAKVGDLELVKAINPYFLENVLQLIADIENYLDKVKVVSNKPKKEKLEKEELARLLVACENYNISEIDAVMADIESYEYEFDDGLAIWLRENVDQMNYTEIIEKLSFL